MSGDADPDIGSQGRVHELHQPPSPGLQGVPEGIDAVILFHGDQEPPGVIQDEVR